MKHLILPSKHLIPLCAIILGLLIFGRLNGIHGQTSIEEPVHFSFTAHTGDSEPVLVLSARINGVDLESGDEIGAFTLDGQCVGAFIWESSRQGFAVWKDDTQTTFKDGFRSGDSISFKFWDRSADKEFDVNRVEYEEGDNFLSDEMGAVVNLEVLLSPSLGDVDRNGAVDFSDAILILRFYVGIIQLDSEQLMNADVDSSNSVDYKDAQQILRFSVDLISSFSSNQN